MRRKVFYLIIIVILCIIPINVMASAGRLVQKSVTQCSSDGKYYGYHTSNSVKHWHTAVKKDGNYWMPGETESLGTSNPCATSNNNSSSGNNSSNNNNSSSSDNKSSNNKSSNSNNNATATSKKSSIAILLSVKVDAEIIDVKDEMSFSTKEDKVSIEALATDSKATVEYERNVALKVGNNEVAIIVKAEDGTKKEYKLIITREQEIVLGNSVGIKVIINGREVIFNNFKSEEFRIGAKDELNIEYELEDQNATTDLKYDEEIKEGATITIKFTVIAENGEEQDYEILLHRKTSTEETIDMVVGIGILGGSGFGVYKIYKKNKKV